MQTPKTLYKVRCDVGSDVEIFVDEKTYKKHCAKYEQLEKSIPETGQPTTYNVINRDDTSLEEILKEISGRG